ncbi:MAG TPA: hypothetical protein VFF73_38040 [Planctomycetota bacterium]|nr:hypothetical protein [Planctomycetota bacterium]
MPLLADTPIVSDAEVAAITGEANLDRLEDAASGLTRANTRAQATNFLMLFLRGAKGVDPLKVANTAELKIPAACQAAYTLMAAQPDPDLQTRAGRLKDRRDEALKLYVFVSTDMGPEETVAPKGLPRTWNFDAEPFHSPLDNRGPWRKP